MAKKDELEFEGGIENAPKPNNSEKLKALQAAMDKIEKSFGKGSIMKMGDDHVQEVEVIPTGSIALNAALGVGGYPKGRIIEIYGPESSGKTTLAIHAIAEAQRAGGIAAFIDAEHAFDRFYAAKLGVDIDNLWISQPDNGEQALEIAEQFHDMAYCREIIKATVLTGETAFRQAQENLILFADNIWWHLYNLACVPDISGGRYTVDGKLELLSTGVEIFRLIFGDEPLFYADRLANSCRQMALLYMEKGDTDAALEQIGRQSALLRQHRLALDEVLAAVSRYELPDRAVHLVGIRSPVDDDAVGGGVAFELFEVMGQVAQRVAFDL